MTKEPREVAGMFDGVARGYDRTSAVLSVGRAGYWLEENSRTVAPQRGEAILDIGAGTGNSAASLARSGAKVIALDFSEGMVEVGRRRHPALDYVVGDAERLPFGDGEFDAVTDSFGLRNVQRPQVALAEMYRVLKPGGRVVICEFSRPPSAIVRGSYFAYLRYVMPLLVSATSSHPRAYRYLFESIKDWPEQATLSEWLSVAGFTGVSHRNLTAGVVALHCGTKPFDNRGEASGSAS